MCSCARSCVREGVCAFVRLWMCAAYVWAYFGTCICVSACDAIYVCVCFCISACEGFCVWVSAARRL